jgi:hypothetical protein
MNPATVLLILKGLDMLAAGLEWAAEERAQWDAWSARLKELIESGESPTEEEYAALDAASDSITERIRAALEAKTPAG